LRERIRATNQLAKEHIKQEKIVAELRETAAQLTKELHFPFKV